MKEYLLKVMFKSLVKVKGLVDYMPKSTEAPDGQHFTDTCLRQSQCSVSFKDSNSPS